MLFSFDFPKQIKRLVPYFKRQLWRLKLIKSLLQPTKLLYDDFISYRETTLYYMSFTGQVISLEHLLNDQYDNTDRDIYIVDTADIVYVYFWNVLENRPNHYLYNKSESKPPLYLKNRDEYISYVHFIIMIPSDVVFNEDSLRALVNRYKIAGKKYSIQIY